MTGPKSLTVNVIFSLLLSTQDPLINSISICKVADEDESPRKSL